MSAPPPVNTHLLVTSSPRELVAAALAGNSIAWGYIIERYQNLVTSIARRYQLSAFDAEDVMQNVWLRLVEHLQDIKEPAALPGWIASITRNETLNLLSRRREISSTDLQIAAHSQQADAADVDDDLLRSETGAAVHSAIGQLRTHHRELVTLLFFSEPKLPYDEISQRLGIPVGSIGPTRARCLQMLRQSAAICAEERAS